MSRLRSFMLTVVAALAVGGAPVTSANAQSAPEAVVGDVVEKDAFEAAKELGTADAWQAFISNYPEGFRADLARAYLKKLDADAASRPAAPAAVTSMNVTRAVYNLGQFTKNGASKSWVEEGLNGVRFYFEEFSRADGGVELLDRSRNLYLTIDVAANVIWTSGSGEPRQRLYDIIGVSADPQTVAPAPPPVAQPQAKAPSKPTAAAKACPKTHQRNSAGKCVWKTNKHGFEVDPWKKPGCSTWQKQCSQGNANACMKYESTCQVN